MVYLYWSLPFSLSALPLPESAGLHCTRRETVGWHVDIIISFTCSCVVICPSGGPGWWDRDCDGVWPLCARPLWCVSHRPGFQSPPPGGHHKTGGVSQRDLARASGQCDGEAPPARPGGNRASTSVQNDPVWCFSVDQSGQYYFHRATLTWIKCVKGHKFRLLLDRLKWPYLALVCCGCTAKGQ